MDADVLKMEEMIMGGGETAADVELAPVKTEDTFTTIIIPQPHPTPVLQSCESGTKSLKPNIYVAPVSKDQNGKSIMH